MMKKYLKPVMEIATGLSTDTFMLTPTIDGGEGPGTGGPGSGGGDAKERDEDFEAFMEYAAGQEGKTNLW